ncbi:MAG: FkbM family methyltransferase [Acidisphaera sp.]|nr:FkbM family methyltransferase [Acidisphaera sp.]MBV9812374.1 FkbM family methyltransferase [Acetobacteraceae bacterium]
MLSHVAGQIDLVRDDLATMRVEIAAQTAASSHSHRAEASAYQAALLDCVMNVAERLTRIETAQVELLRHAEFTASGFTNQLGALAEQTAHLVQMGRGVVPLGVGSEGSDFLVRSPSGWLIVPGEDERLLTAMVETGGVLERGTTAVVAALLRPGDTIIDVGAHIGTLTLPAARKVGATGRVIAVEPASRALGALRRTLHLNGLSDRVELHHWAAGAAEAEAKLRLSPVLGESTLVEGPDAEVSATATVAIRPLDALTHPGPVRLVKIDVEGYEMAVWQGMQRLLDRDPDLAVIIEFGPSHLARAGVPETSWFEALTSNGFAVWEIDQVSAVLRPLRPAGERSGILSINLLLLRRPISAYAGLVVADKQPAPA